MNEMEQYLEQYLERFEQLMDNSLLTTVIDYGISMLFMIPAFVLMAIALHCMARRRGIYHTWTAWVPVANAWMVGCLSDQYRAVVLDQRSNRRKSLLWLNLGRTVLTALVSVFAAIFLIRLWKMGLLDLQNLESLEQIDEETALAILEQMAVPLFGLLLCSIPAAVLSVLYYITFYKSLSDIYKSCDPHRARLLMILSLAVGLGASLAMGLPIMVIPAVFLFLCRHRDWGMPLREPITEVIAQPVPEAEPEVYCLPQTEPAEEIMEEPMEESAEESVPAPETEN